MKRQNVTTRRRGYLWTITVGSVAAALGFWGIFSQSQALNAANSGTVDGTGQTSASNIQQAIPTLVPQIDSSVNSFTTTGRVFRPSPITRTRSSR